MAGTEEGAQLTGEYRSGQLATRANALREVARLWAGLDAANLGQTVSPFSTAAAAIAGSYARDSADETVRYLTRFRDAEGARGKIRFRAASPLDLDQAAGLLRGTAITGVVNARRAGQSIARAKDNALVKVIGEVGKLVLGGGRRTIVRAADDDPAAAGWERVTSSGACYFCLMLVSRGPVYRSQRSASFEAHGHCACTAELLYERSDASEQLGEDWDRVTAGKSGADARNAWRQYVDQQRPAAPTTAAPVIRTKPPAKQVVVPYVERIAKAAKDGDALAVARFGLRKVRPDEFTSDMSRAVNTYTGAEYNAINAYLRGTTMPYGYTADDVVPVIKNLDAAFALSSTEADAVTYRGILDARTIFGDRVDGDLTGMEWTEQAPVSTSAKQLFAERFAGRSAGRMVMRVLVPKGTQAIEASGMDLEAELLIGPKRKVRVVADRGVSPAGVREIDVEIIG